jgi:hypothetical protein
MAGTMVWFKLGIPWRRQYNLFGLSALVFPHGHAGVSFRPKVQFKELAIISLQLEPFASIQTQQY